MEGDQKAEEAIVELMAAVDSYIPTPQRDVDKPFLLCRRRIYYYW